MKADGWMGIRPMTKELWKAVQGMEGGWARNENLRMLHSYQLSGKVTDLLRKGFAWKSNQVSNHGMPLPHTGAKAS
jgi:hypothetical protein